MILDDIDFFGTQSSAIFRDAHSIYQINLEDFNYDTGFNIVMNNQVLISLIE